MYTLFHCTVYIGTFNSYQEAAQYAASCGMISYDICKN